MVHVLRLELHVAVDMQEMAAARMVTEESDGALSIDSLRNRRGHDPRFAFYILGRGVNTCPKPLFSDPRIAGRKIGGRKT